ncbi:hypothetical protein [Streptomyces lasiicapitis]|uniref:Uncharacterized protein n=1 Tax=Streptomyces lasiicapitis TaxID=1923961 RepID=A0ABQ2MIC2_9ACTN|nr:hypothetical protein [Streptomyces lasiicapitis]GGO52285.1 hypothetical protein GCM10012286_56950 [Streptomyces lasiicapitis]
MSEQQGEQGGPVVAQDIGPWVVEMQWPEGVTQGGPAVLVVRPKDRENRPLGGISSTVLREIDFKAAAERLRAQAATSEMRSQAREEYEAGRTERLRQALAQGVTDEYLAMLASAYVNYLSGGGKGPLAHLAERVGKGESTIKGHLWQARKRGLLIGTPGRAGGVLTLKAIAILTRVVPGGERISIVDVAAETAQEKPIEGE